MQENITVKIGADIADLSKGLASAKRDLGSFGNDMKNVGTGLATSFGAATLAIGAGLGFAVKKAADFDSQIRKAGAIAGASAKELDKMKEASLSLGATTSESASSVALAMTELAAKGFNANQAIAAMPGIIAAAEASGEDLALAADTVSTALNIWGLEATESARVADVLAMSANVSAAGIDDLGYVLKYAGGPASALGITLEELAAAAGILSNAGLDGSNSGTALRASLLALNNPAKAQREIMKELGFSVLDASGNAKGLSQIVGELGKSLEGETEAQKVATLGKLVGTEAVSGFLALMKAGPTEIDKMSESLRNSGGASAEAAAKMKAGIGGALENLSGAFESLTITIGDQLVPYVQTVATALAGLAEKFTGLSDGTKKFLVIGTALVGIFTAIVAAIGITLAIVGSAITGLGAIATAMGITTGAAGLLSAAFAVITGPIGLTVAAIVGIIAVLVVAYKKIDWFREGVNKAWDAIKAGTMKAFTAIKEVVSTLISATVKFGSEQLAKFKAFWDENGAQIMSGVKFYFNAVAAYIKVIMSVIKGVFEYVFPIIYHAVRIAFEAIKLVIGNVMTLVLGIIQTALKLLKGDWAGAWDTIKQTTVKMMLGVVNFLKAVDLKQVGIDIIRGLIKGITSMITGVTGAIKDIAGSIPEWAKKVLGIKSPSRVMMAIGEWTGIGMANGIEATKKRNEAVTKELGNVIASVAKSNASEVATINKTASSEQSTIAKKSADAIAEIYAKARDAKRKLTASEVRKIAKIEDDADSKILANKRKHQAEIAKVDKSSAKERLDAIKQFVDNKKQLEQVSLIDEVNIWRKSAESFKDGTQEKISAQIQYRDALAKVNSEITSINETYAGKMSAINDKLRADEEALTKTYTDSLQSRMSSLMSFAGIFDAFDVKVEQSGSELLSNLNSQVDGFKLWQSEIEKISGKAIDAGLLEELRQMGPKALPQLLALNSLTSDQLSQYSALYQEKALLARQQAEAELVGMKADTAKRITELRATANKELSLLQAEWVTKIKSVTKATSDEFKTLTQIGITAGQNLLNGLSSMEGALVAQATAIARAINSALQSTLGGSVKVAGYSTPSTSAGVSSTVRNSSSSTSSSGTTFTGAMNVTIDAKSVKDISDLTKLFDKQTIQRK